jgi:hydrogenase expression/formation protein HypE
MVAIVAAEDAERALSLIQSAKYGANARIIGEVQAPRTEDERGRLTLRTRIGGRRSLDVLQGEGLPRIC